MTDGGIQGPVRPRCETCETTLSSIASIIILVAVPLQRSGQDLANGLRVYSTREECEIKIKRDRLQLTIRINVLLLTFVTCPRKLDIRLLPLRLRYCVISPLIR